MAHRFCQRRRLLQEVGNTSSTALVTTNNATIANTSRVSNATMAVAETTGTGAVSGKANFSASQVATFRTRVGGVKTLHSLHVAIFPTGTIDLQEMKCAVAGTFGQVVGTTYFDSSKSDCLMAQLKALLRAAPKEATWFALVPDLVYVVPFNLLALADRAETNGYDLVGPAVELNPNTSVVLMREITRGVLIRRTALETSLKRATKDTPKENAAFVSAAPTSALSDVLSTVMD